MSTVAVFTATTGRDTLQQTVDSVLAQTTPCQHYVIADGVESLDRIRMGRGLLSETLHLVTLPNPTGRNGMMNGAILAMSAYIATEDYLCFCDDDNWYEPDHVQSLVEALESKNAAYAYSLRKLVHPDGSFYDYDNGESLGHFGDLVDANCLLMRRDLATGIAPLWYNTNGQMNVSDRFVWAALKQNNVPWAASGRYTVNYRMSARGVDMKPFFFMRNILAKSKFPDAFPWAA